MPNPGDSRREAVVPIDIFDVTRMDPRPTPAGGDIAIYPTTAKFLGAARIRARTFRPGRSWPTPDTTGSRSP